MTLFNAKSQVSLENALSAAAYAMVGAIGQMFVRDTAAFDPLTGNFSRDMPFYALTGLAGLVGFSRYGTTAAKKLGTLIQTLCNKVTRADYSDIRPGKLETCIGSLIIATSALGPAAFAETYGWTSTPNKLVQAPSGLGSIETRICEFLKDGESFYGRAAWQFKHNKSIQAALPLKNDKYTPKGNKTPLLRYIPKTKLQIRDFKEIPVNKQVLRSVVLHGYRSTYLGDQLIESDERFQDAHHRVDHEPVVVGDGKKADVYLKYCITTGLDDVKWYGSNAARTKNYGPFSTENELLRAFSE